MKKLFRKLQLKRKRGFTLIEILVVLLVIVALTAITVPTYQKVIRKSRVSDGLRVLDILANAQGKYFVEHKQYASRLRSLNAPVKELHQGAGGNDIILTSNFIYTKEYADDCIKAKEQHNGNYTLVKNYKTNSKIGCVGDGCENISDYVEQATLNGVCPAVNTCELSAESCSPQHFWPSDCSCACDESDYLACAGIFDPDTCQCTTPGTNGCSPEGASLGTGTYITGPEGECSYPGPIPAFWAGHGKSVDPGTPTLNQEPDTYCGIKTRIVECEHLGGPWVTKEECVYKAYYCHSLGMVLNSETCECERPCDENHKPLCSTTGSTVCDPCPNDPPMSSIIQQILSDGQSSGQCLHCGYKPAVSGDPTCVDGQWVCPGAENTPCQQVTIDDFGAYIDCNGGFPDNTCGQKELIRIKCFHENGSIPEINLQYSDCELKQGNNCFTGDTTSEGCLANQIKTCEDCHWSDCQDLPCDMHNQPQNYVSQYNCGAHTFECLNVEGVWRWVDVFTPFGDYECDNGSVESCAGGGQRTCEDCMWSDCQEGPEPCSGDLLIPGQTDAHGFTNVRLCHTHNGETNEDLYCGVQITQEQVCEDNHYVWDFSNSPCNSEVKPEGEPESLVSPQGCFYKKGEYTCVLDNNQASWVPGTASGEWLPTAPGNNCEDGLGGLTPSDQELCKNCKLYHCPSNAQINKQLGACFVQGHDYRAMIAQRRHGWWPFRYCEPDNFPPVPTGTLSGQIRACKKIGVMNYLGPCEQQNPYTVICGGDYREMYITVDRLYNSWRDYCGRSTYAKQYAYATTSLVRLLGYADDPESCSAAGESVCVPDMVISDGTPGWYVCEEVPSELNN